MSRAVLGVFLKKPRCGHVKTRLIPHLGAHETVALYERLLARTIDTVGPLNGPDLRVELWIEAGDDSIDGAWIDAAGLNRLRQANGDLGQRMQHAFDRAFVRRGVDKAVVIGTDCPGLTQEHIAQALSVLEDRDAAIGPSIDGGYYLLGLSRPAPELFADVPWSTGNVLALTRDRLAAAKRTHGELPTLRDLDTPEDLHDLARQYPALLGRFVPDTPR